MFVYFTGDSMVNVYGHDTVHGMAFSTYDKYTSPVYCDPHYDGGWWFNSCSYTYLNGPWTNYSLWPWHPTVDFMRDVRGTLMMIRPN